MGACHSETQTSITSVAPAFENFMAQVLSPEDVQHFKEHVYVHLESAFAPDAARQAMGFVWDLLERDYGYDRREPDSWHGANKGLNRKLHANEDLWGTGDSRLVSAITQLLGGNWTRPKQWGTLLFTVPDHSETWNVPTGWHWDSNPFER